LEILLPGFAPSVVDVIRTRLRRAIVVFALASAAGHTLLAQGFRGVPQPGQFSSFTTEIKSDRFRTAVFRVESEKLPGFVKQMARARSSRRRLVVEFSRHASGGEIVARMRACEEQLF
jgi:hypothetical protein